MMTKTTKITPNIIEFFGLPKTGKTTASLAVEDYLRQEGYSVVRVKERASVSPIRDKLHPLFNLWTSVALLKEYVEACDRQVDIVIADRGVLDALIWANFLGSNDLPENSNLSKVSFLPIFTENMVAAYFFSAEIDVIIKRRSKRLATNRPGTVVNESVMTRYMSSYSELSSSLISSIIEIDTSQLSIEEMIARVIEDLSMRLENIST